MSFRIFVASSTETQVAEAAPGVEEAMELMLIDGVPAEKAASLAVAAAKDGRDPVAFARHFVKVRKAIRT